MVPAMTISRFGRRLGALAALLLLATGTAVATSSPAHASYCPSGALCYWTNSNYSGSSEIIYPTTSCKNLTFPNQASSMRYAGSPTINVYYGRNCSGSGDIIHTGEYEDNFNWSLCCTNDQWESVRIRP